MFSQGGFVVLGFFGKSNFFYSSKFIPLPLHGVHQSSLTTKAQLIAEKKNAYWKYEYSNHLSLFREEKLKGCTQILDVFNAFSEKNKNNLWCLPSEHFVILSCLDKYRFLSYAKCKIWDRIILETNFQELRTDINYLKTQKDAWFQRLATITSIKKKKSHHRAFNCGLHTYSNHFKILQAFGYKPVTYW